MLKSWGIQPRDKKRQYKKETKTEEWNAYVIQQSQRDIRRDGNSSKSEHS